MTRRFTIGTIAVVLAGFLWLPLYVHFLRNRADFMLQTAYELSEQKQTPTVAQIRELYGTRLKQLDGCTGSDRGYEVTFSNRSLAALRPVPYAEMQTVFQGQRRCCARRDAELHNTGRASLQRGKPRPD